MPQWRPHEPASSCMQQSNQAAKSPAAWLLCSFLIQMDHIRRAYPTHAWTPKPSLMSVFIVKGLPSEKVLSHNKVMRRPEVPLKVVHLAQVAPTPENFRLVLMLLLLFLLPTILQNTATEPTKQLCRCHWLMNCHPPLWRMMQAQSGKYIRTPTDASTLKINAKCLRSTNFEFQNLRNGRVFLNTPNCLPVQLTQF